jgi:hypothetical protein
MPRPVLPAHLVILFDRPALSLPTHPQTLLEADPQLKATPPALKFAELASAGDVEATVAALTKNGWNVVVVPDGAAALEALQKFASTDALYFAAGSTSLQEIGWTEWLKAHAGAFKRNIKVGGGEWALPVS